MQRPPVVDRRPSRAMGTTFLVLAVLLLATVVATWVGNPFRTATHDPRGRVLGYMTYRIASSSMAPTLQVGDLIFVTTPTYRRHGPRIGHVVAFQRARGPGMRPEAFVYRVVARGGDRVEIRDAVVYVNDEPLQEPYVPAGAARHARSTTMDAVTVPAANLFVLGDNRDNAEDSRFIGFVPESQLIGRVRRIWMSPDPQRTGEIR